MSTEASWVRSVYLYLMCAVSVALVGVGAVMAVVGLVHTIAPDLGHRDTIDRVGIGLANVASSVVDLMGEGQLDGAESYCEDVTDNEDDFQQCVEEEQSFNGGDEMESIQDGIGEVKDELRSQIRYSSIDRLIQGLLMVGAGVLLFRIHGRRTELFADGLVPRAPTPGPDTTSAEPVPLEPLAPPPPSAP